MKIIRLMHGKLHRVRVTSANVDYIGSISIDPDLMEKVGILPLEEVDIVNLNNAHRWSTYAIPALRGSREICPNGGAALLCQPDDILIIYAYEQCDRHDIMMKGHKAKVLVADENNNIADFFEQTLTNNNGEIEFQERVLGN
ncbi:MAG: aspartate 1-decarboxylase [Cyanobacteria bacterium]|nr:aspartate 1-decarboxylase [Cyanobacteria bacterium CG_2015-16_32_12]NCO76722.1 aspartate 1-decarboxylase [Cyanobacteria bacterium CG_2015-22_32_23]NCQ04717.1 aspartate 1-decarboxylase [Cyanobacteria bacterium CG_2015-09_32_10]NCQ40738.1 aspartate 1-decarboxylase [Cyanobacteria bacterium CG_2015-04_32_10]NCS85249.1 aspartate 1-decarboxylase [Cyanobacteria bacterium CG_2015-02_32_10]